MKEIAHLEVRYHGRLVGILAETKERKCAFQYDDKWLETREKPSGGFSLNPFSLPLQEKVYIPKKDVFDGLFGVFADSLPDGWGRLLVDRILLSRKISPASVTPLMRLGIVGSTGMGALEYVPQLMELTRQEQMTFDQMAQECEALLREENSKELDALFLLGASSGGARPKVLISVEGQAWMVKFPAAYDSRDIGEEEYRYMRCAEHCGIAVPEVRLFPSAVCKGYYGAKRFDRTEDGRVHMVTVSGLLETSHRVPNLDYHDLMKLTHLLTRDMTQTEEMYRRMCFNVFAHNRDDHSKNFSFLYDEKEGRWRLTPAYDLTYSSSLGGEHATCVNGNGRNPGREDLLEVGQKAGLSRSWMKRTMSEIEEIVNDDLGEIIRERL